jgi:hypothetical protein
MQQNVTKCSAITIDKDTSITITRHFGKTIAKRPEKTTLGSECCLGCEKADSTNIELDAPLKLHTQHKIRQQTHKLRIQP